MSRIGKKPIQVPKEVTIKVTGDALEVQGPKGTLVTPVMPGISFKLEEGVLTAESQGNEKRLSAYHGLCRSLAANAVEGVMRGFTKELAIEGIGYKAEVKGKELVLNLGFSHPVHFPIPEGITISAEKNVNLTISGIDRQKVGQVAADIRNFRPPDCYKGKGIRYRGEIVRKKVGKAAVGAGG